MFVVKATIARILYAQGRDIFRIMELTERLYTKPPVPAPADARPAANERLLVNHCGTTPMVPRNRKPIPQPEHKPWLKNSCHIEFENDAPTSERASRHAPMYKLVRVPYERVV